MKNILYLVIADIFVPFYLQLGRYLEGHGYRPHYVSFLPREHRLLRKNQARVLPSDVHGIRHYPVKPALFSEREIEDITDFIVRKLGGEMHDWRERLLRAASCLDDMLAQHAIDAVVIWNGEDFLGKALAILARRRGIATVFGENGYFPGTLQFDRRGVNVRSSISAMPFAELCRQSPCDENAPPLASRADKPNGFSLAAVEPLGWPEYASCFLARKANPAYYRQFPEHRGGSWFSSRWLQLRKSLVRPDRAALPKKFIFIPFQVHDDTQILLNSPSFKNMESFFEFCHAAIRRNFGKEYRIVVKEHPEDLCRYSYAKLHAKYPDVLWLRKYDVDELLDKAAYVFVVNSSVGLQALERGKPTVVFGDSFYTKEEVVFRVTDPAHIDAVLQRARAGLSDAMRRDIGRFILHLKEAYFVRAGWKAVTAEGVTNAGDRIRALLADAAPSLSHSLAVAGKASLAHSTGGLHHDR